MMDSDLDKMVHQFPTYQEPPQPHPAAGEVLNYQGTTTMMPSKVATTTSTTPLYATARPIELDISYDYVLCGIWIGISFVFVALGSIVVLSTFCAIINADSFPNIQAFHQIAAVNDQTFKVVITIYVVSVCSLFFLQGGALDFQDCWWACMQIFCGVQMVFFLSMMVVWAIPQIFRFLAWVFRLVFGLIEDETDDDDEDHGRRTHYGR